MSFFPIPFLYEGDALPLKQEKYRAGHGVLDHGPVAHVVLKLDLPHVVWKLLLDERIASTIPEDGTKSDEIFLKICGHTKKSNGCYTRIRSNMKRMAFAGQQSRTSRYRQYEAGLPIQGHTGPCSPSHRRARPWSPSRELWSSDQLIGTEREYTPRPIAPHMPARGLHFRCLQAGALLLAELDLADDTY
jgi:hypothetical protein